MVKRVIRKLLHGLMSGRKTHTTLTRHPLTLHLLRRILPDSTGRTVTRRLQQDQTLKIEAQ